MYIGRRLSLISLLFGFIVTLPAAAAGPSFWTVSTAADFLKGISNGVYVSLGGTVTPGPSIANRLTSTPAQVWSLAQSPDGTLWAGTGGDGRVIRLRPGQTPEETVFDAPEANIFAVSAAGTRVYAASSPDGKVYVIEGDNPAREFFDPTETYIWALQTDSNGNLWVGAGSPAVVYRVAADGTSQVVHRPPAGHVVTLVTDGQGRMLAGTESPGRLYRYGEGDRPFVVLDTGLAELRAVTSAADGVMFAAGLAKGDEPAASGEATSVAVTMAATATTGTQPSSNNSPARRSVIYRIDAAGSWEEIWTTADVVYDLAAQSDGGVLVATGPDGRLYKITAGLDVLLFTGVDARQIVRFAPPAGGEPLSAFATANPGRVVSLGPGEQTEASYLSSLLDTKSVATWGVLRWTTSGAVQLYVRSGNTERIDDSWSDWSGPYTRAEGEQVTAPAARFVQWRATFTGNASETAPTLSSVTLAYLPRNNRPVVTSVTTHPPGVVFHRAFVNDESAVAGLDDASIEARRPPGEDPPSPPPLTRRMMQKGLQTLTWRAEDADDDLLTYTVQYRRDGDNDWQDLRSDLTGTILVWDTTTVPDGRYVLRVLASDSPSNAADRALVGSRQSDPINVDNTPPSLDLQMTGGAAARRLVIIARDAQSAIQRVEYSVRGGPWQLVHPTDGMADSLEERYEIVLPENIAGSAVMVRVTDQHQNVAARAAPGS